MEIEKLDVTYILRKYGRNCNYLDVFTNQRSSSSRILVILNN